jgi:hypothetical protein
MFTAAKISTFFQTSKLFRIIVRIMSDFLYFCTYKACIEISIISKNTLRFLVDSNVNRYIVPYFYQSSSSIL